jgi:thiamine-phosphate pyrophosphorylase
VLRAPGFPEAARSILAAHGAAVALHLRGHGLAGGELYRLAEEIAPATAAGGLLLVNDRVDLALAAGAGGAQLGRRSIPIEMARRILGPERWLGYSAHGAEEARRVEVEGADFIVFGTIFPSATHPGEPTAGVEGLRRTASHVTLPLIAIGGMTPDRVGEVRAAGGHGIAVLGGVWHADRPEDAAAAFHLKIEEEW